FAGLLKAREKFGEGQAVMRAKPEHYGQMQMYMHKTGIERSLYVAVNKNTDAIFVERIKYDFKYANRLENNARRVAFDSAPPPRISDKSDFYLCRFCRFADRCHELTQDLPEVNCRTCIYSEPVEGGDWLCKKHKIDTDRARQNAACSSHLYNPEFINGQQIDYDLSAGWVEYAMPDGTTYTNSGPSDREDLTKTSAEDA
ncbi:MAG: hypothetical protein AAGL99_17005, partial [Pseudomonadota bacterium]